MMTGTKGHDESGFVLIDALVAIVVLALIGASFIRLHAESTYWFHERRLREGEMAVAERLLVAHTMLEVRDLDLRLGVREVGDYMVMVQRPTPALYRIGVSRRLTPDKPEIETMIYRPPVQAER